VALRTYIQIEAKGTLLTLAQRDQMEDVIAFSSQDMMGKCKVRNQNGFETVMERLSKHVILL